MLTVSFLYSIFALDIVKQNGQVCILFQIKYHVGFFPDHLCVQDILFVECDLRLYLDCLLCVCAQYLFVLLRLWFALLSPPKWPCNVQVSEAEWLGAEDGRRPDAA